MSSDADPTGERADKEHPPRKVFTVGKRDPYALTVAKLDEALRDPTHARHTEAVETQERMAEQISRLVESATGGEAMTHFLDSTMESVRSVFDTASETLDVPNDLLDVPAPRAVELTPPLGPSPQWQQVERTEEVVEQLVTVTEVLRAESESNRKRAEAAEERARAAAVAADAQAKKDEASARRRFRAEMLVLVLTLLVALGALGVTVFLR